MTWLPWAAELAAAFDAPVGGPLTLALVTRQRDACAWARAGAELGRYTFVVPPPAGSACARASGGARPPWRRRRAAAGRALSLTCVPSNGWTIRSGTDDGLGGGGGAGGGGVGGDAGRRGRRSACTST